MHHWTGHMVVYPLTWNRGTLSPPRLTPCGVMHPIGILSWFYYVTLSNQEFYHENIYIGQFYFSQHCSTDYSFFRKLHKIFKFHCINLVTDFLVTE